MTDDWSLKGKEFEPYESAITRYVYSKEDIEILRQKIIEDVNKIREDLFSGRNWKTVVQSVIKQRFGVDK